MNARMQTLDSGLAWPRLGLSQQREFILRADSDAALSCSAPAPRDAAAFCFRPRATDDGSESECERAFANTLAQTLENFRPTSGVGTASLHSSVRTHSLVANFPWLALAYRGVAEREMS